MIALAGAGASANSRNITGGREDQTKHFIQHVYICRRLVDLCTAAQMEADDVQRRENVQDLGRFKGRGSLLVNLEATGQPLPWGNACRVPRAMMFVSVCLAATDRLAEDEGFAPRGGV
jgi:hypothetical protein